MRDSRIAEILIKTMGGYPIAKLREKRESHTSTMIALTLEYAGRQTVAGNKRDEILTVAQTTVRDIGCNILTGCDSPDTRKERTEKG